MWYNSFLLEQLTLLTLWLCSSLTSVTTKYWPSSLNPSLIPALQSCLIVLYKNTKYSCENNTLDIELKSPLLQPFSTTYTVILFSSKHTRKVYTIVYQLFLRCFSFSGSPLHCRVQRSGVTVTSVHYKVSHSLLLSSLGRHNSGKSPLKQRKRSHHSRSQPSCTYTCQPSQLSHARACAYHVRAYPYAHVINCRINSFGNGRPAARSIATAKLLSTDQPKLFRQVRFTCVLRSYPWSLPNLSFSRVIPAQKFSFYCSFFFFFFISHTSLTKTKKYIYM